MLHETEEALNRASMEKLQRGNEINSLRKQIEKEFLEKGKLEDDIMEVIRNQLTFDKAAQYTDRITKKCRMITKDLEAQIAQVENEIATDSLSTVTTMAKITNLKASLDELEKVIGQKNDIINKSENESVKRNAVIERKQQVIDQFNKRLEQMISQAGGVELGPLEITINSLSKSIEHTAGYRPATTHLAQGTGRTNAIDKENSETAAIEKNIRNLRNDMLKLNQMLFEENGAFESLEKDNILTENEFMGKLKDAELNSIQMQAKLDSLKEEKERLLNSLVESERQIMLWEKKTQLARETRAAVDSEVGQGEISAMKSEIHRMEVRYAQLMRQQEKMIQDMEKAVSRRDTIVTRGDAQAKIAARSKSKDKTVTKGTFQRQQAELKKKIKATIQDAQSCDDELQGLRNDQKQLGQMLETKQIRCRELESNADSLDGDIERQLEMKQRNMADLVAKQQKTKYYMQIKDRKYKRLVKDDDLLESEKEKQIDKMQSLSNIVERLQEEFPHLQPHLRKVSFSLGTRIWRRVLLVLEALRSQHRMWSALTHSSNCTHTTF
ncbi:CCDC40 [Bugula neritina]|uniref:CCDC40 n=1 Tax=Bugula neritina TaxID=10212 RepID=A0A7J7KQ43_BUGNE|nr:CCDC40 [Bugula neritina]